VKDHVAWHERDVAREIRNQIVGPPDHFVADRRLLNDLAVE
jgi:hypothetical protein